MTANVLKCAVLICNEELPIVDQYTYLGVEISKDCQDAQMTKVVSKRNARHM